MSGNRRIRACHRYVTDECRANKGDDQARAEAVQSAAEEMASLMDAWPQGSEAIVHVTVDIEYPG